MGQGCSDPASCPSLGPAGCPAPRSLPASRPQPSGLPGRAWAGGIRTQPRPALGQPRSCTCLEEGGPLCSCRAGLLDWDGNSPQRNSPSLHLHGPTPTSRGAESCVDSPGAPCTQTHHIQPSQGGSAPRPSHTLCWLILVWLHTKYDCVAGRLAMKNNCLTISFLTIHLNTLGTQHWEMKEQIDTRLMMKLFDLV